MPLRRIDATTVVDDFGNPMWLPDLSAPGMMADRDQSGGPAPTFPDSGQPFSGISYGQPLPPGPGPGGLYPPPPPTDPSAALMDPTTGIQLPAQPDAISGVGAPLSQPTGPQPGAAPANPYTTPGVDVPYPMPSVGPAAKTPAGADAAVGQAFNEAAAYSSLAGQAKMDEEAAQAQRELGARGTVLDEYERINAQNVANWDKSKAQQDRIYALAAQKADQETADWLRENQAAASAEVDHSRYFNSKSTFGQIAWIVGLFAGAFSAGADQSKNVALGMLRESIKQDNAEQSDRIQRMLDASKAKGQVLKERQARDFGKLADDASRASQFARDQASASWQKWSAVEKYAMAKAALPGPEKTKAGYAAMASAAAAEKLKITEDRAKQAHQDANEAAQRSISWANVSIAQQASKRADRQQMIDVAQNEEARGDKYALASMSAEAKGAQGGFERKDLRVLPRVTGFRVRNEDGTEEDVVVPKEQYEAMAKSAQVASDKAAALKNLRKAFVNSDGTSRVFNSDAELQAAIQDALAPVAKDLNGGGRLTDEDVARASQSLLGYDHNSILSKVKGPDKEEVLRHIDNQISQLPTKAGQDLAIQSGMPLRKGSRIVFTPPSDLGVQDTKAPTAEDELAAGGVKTAGAEPPKTVEDVRAAREKAAKVGWNPNGTTLPDLPDELDGANGVLTDLERRASTTVHAKELAEAATKAIDAWESKQKDKASAKRYADDARLRVQAIGEDGAAVQAKADKLVEEAALFSHGDTLPYINKRADRLGISLTTQEIQALAAEADRRIRQKAGIVRPDEEIQVPSVVVP